MNPSINVSEFRSFSSSRLRDHGKIWHDKPIWRIIQSYPPDLKSKFEHLYQCYHKFIDQGDFSDLSSDINFNYRFLDRFYYYLSKTERLEESFARAGGLKLEFGIAWSKFKIQEYYQKHLTKPRKSIYPFDAMYYLASKGVFQHQGIDTWTDLLSDALVENFNYVPSRLRMRGQAGLERTRRYLQMLYSRLGRLPRSDDEGALFIFKALRRGVWREFRIHKWIDLLSYVFGNVSFQSVGKLNASLHPEIVQKSNEKALIHAKKQLIEYQNLNNKIPVGKDFPKIARYCYQKKWSAFGIHSWYGLVQDIFKVEPCISWRGLEGLNRARKILIEIYRIHKRIPKWNDLKISSIISCIHHGYWTAWGIHCWSDLKTDVFNNTTPVS